MTEGPYKLPQGWRWVRLGDIAYKPQYGYTSAATSTPIGPKFVRITDITSGSISWDRVPYCEIDARSFEKYQLHPGDLLFARSGSVGTTILIKEVPCEAVFASYLIRVRLKETVSPEFVSLVLKAPFCQNQFFPLGAAQKNINAKAIQRIPIPLPPLEEQRRIVAKVEALMARVREAQQLRAAALADAERLMPVALAEVFPRPGADLPPGWLWVRLGEIAKAINGCGFPKRYQGRQTGPIAFLKVSDLNRPENDPEVTRAANYVDENTLELLGGHPCKPGTIVFPKIGGAIATNKKRKLGITAAFDNNVMGLVLNEEVVSSDYLLLWTFTVDLTTLSKVGPVPSIRQSTVENQRIPLPPLEEQRRIIDYLDAIKERVKALKDAQAATEAELKRLEQAILDKAFRGEL